MTIQWTLKNAAGSPIAHAVPDGDTLALRYDRDGVPHLFGCALESVDVVEVDVSGADTGPVTIELAPDEPGYVIDREASNPQQDPTEHAGTLTWPVSSTGLAVMTFTVPTAQNETWGWVFGEPVRPIPLKMKVRLRRA